MPLLEEAGPVSACTAPPLQLQAASAADSDDEPTLQIDLNENLSPGPSFDSQFESFLDSYL